MFALFTEWVVLVPDFKYASNSCRERPFQTNFRWTESKFKKKKWQTKKKRRKRNRQQVTLKFSFLEFSFEWNLFCFLFVFLLVFLKNFCLAFDIIIWCCYFLIIYTQVDFMLRKSASMCVMTCPSVMKRRPYLCNDIGFDLIFLFHFSLFSSLYFYCPPSNSL